MRRLHPLSAVQRVLGTAFQTASTGFFFGLFVVSILLDGPSVAALLLGVAGALVGGVFGIARYLRFEYEAAGDTLSVTSGVLNRQERDIPLGRIQNVDVSRNLLQRALGLAVVRFETAGGSGTEAVLDAVSLDEARRLQDVVAAHDRDQTAPTPGETTEDTEPGTGGATAPEPDRDVLYELGLTDLLVLGTVSARPAAPLFVVFGTPFLEDVALGIIETTTAALGGPDAVALELLPAYSPADLALVLAVALVEFAIATWVISAVLTAVSYYGFRLERVGDELRYERGLLGRYSGSIPLEKVQTVTVRETAPMRRLGRAALDVETAGYGPGGNQRRGSNTAIPLDDQETVVDLATSLGGFDYPTSERPPKRARRRYAVRFALVPLAVALALYGVGVLWVSLPWWLVLLALPLAPLAGHLAWTNRGHALVAKGFVARSGFWRRTTQFVPYDRVQTVVATRTVFQRYRDLASVTADTASSASLFGRDATAHDVDEGTARRIHRRLRTALDEHLRERQ